MRTIMTNEITNSTTQEAREVGSDYAERRLLATADKLAIRFSAGRSLSRE
jgi:hypothetical protein